MTERTKGESVPPTEFDFGIGSDLNSFAIKGRWHPRPEDSGLPENVFLLFFVAILGSILPPVSVRGTAGGQR